MVKTIFKWKRSGLSKKILNVPWMELRCMKDRYCQIRAELTSLWKILQSPAQKSEKLKSKLLKVRNLAIKIGGKTERDAEKLKGDVNRYLLGELDHSEIMRMFSDALKLEQDTREL